MDKPVYTLLGSVFQWEVCWSSWRGRQTLRNWPPISGPGISKVSSTCNILTPLRAVTSMFLCRYCILKIGMFFLVYYTRLWHIFLLSIFIDNYCKNKHWDLSIYDMVTWHTLCLIPIPRTCLFQLVFYMVICHRWREMMSSAYLRRRRSRS